MSQADRNRPGELSAAAAFDRAVVAWLAAALVADYRRRQAGGASSNDASPIAGQGDAGPLANAPLTRADRAHDPTNRAARAS